MSKLSKHVIKLPSAGPEAKEFPLRDSLLLLMTYEMIYVIFLFFFGSFVLSISV